LIVQLSRRHLAPRLDPLARVERAERSAHLVQQEREGVEERRRRCGRTAAIGDGREKSPNDGLEPGLFVGLANHCVQDPFAVMDAAGR
jgi:hypothetical protein